MDPIQPLIYHHEGAAATMQLSGNIDLCLATALHELALGAIADHAAETVTLDLSQTERLDIAALQILLALQRDIRADGRTLVVVGLPPELLSYTTGIGIEF